MYWTLIAATWRFPVTKNRWSYYVRVFVIQRGQNFPLDTPAEHIFGLLGSKGVRDGPFEDGGNPVANADVPDEFDAREKWQECQLIGHVYDQGSCGSCWVSDARFFFPRLWNISEKTGRKITYSIETHEMWQ